MSVKNDTHANCYPLTRDLAQEVQEGTCIAIRSRVRRYPEARVGRPQDTEPKSRQNKRQKQANNTNHARILHVYSLLTLLSPGEREARLRLGTDRNGFVCICVYPPKCVRAVTSAAHTRKTGYTRRKIEDLPKCVCA